MSGICLELLHLGDTLTDCTVCFKRPQQDAEDDDDGQIVSSTSLTYRAHTPISASYGYSLLPSYPNDHLDACGKRVRDVIMTSYGPESSLDKSRLSVDALLAMSPIVDGRDLVQMAARHLFLSLVKTQDNVREVFFPDHTKQDDNLRLIDQQWFDLRRFACLYLSQTICDIKDDIAGLHRLLDENQVYTELEIMYTSHDWKKVGFALYAKLFSDLVKDEKTKVPFSAFLVNEPRDWARRLSERVQERQWVYANLIAPIVQNKTTAEYNRDINTLFLKLHLLDPSTVM